MVVTSIPWLPPFFHMVDCLPLLSVQARMLLLLLFSGGGPLGSHRGGGGGCCFISGLNCACGGGWGAGILILDLQVRFVRADAWNEGDAWVVLKRGPVE